MKQIKKILVLFLALVIGMTAVPSSSEAASAPSLKAKVTQNNITKLLKKYDPDGAYIIKKSTKAGYSPLSYYSSGNTIVDRIDTAVHEGTHAYSFSYNKNYDYAYFVGSKKAIYVNFTDVFPTKEMAQSVPAKNRTFRFSTYVGNPSADMASNKQGAYGLLNEFMAYQSGMQTMLNLYDYLADKNAGISYWAVFLNACENDMLAYAEFKYYILHYLYYAKNNHKSVYRGIINNKQFCKAYKKIESKYARQIRKYQKDLNKLKKLLSAKGYTMTVSDSRIRITNGSKGYSIGRYYMDYSTLEKTLIKNRYQKIQNKLVKNAG